MARSQKRNAILPITDQEMRDQEVMRANRELAAYFKGQRTEREARAALKIIKAFVRQREREREKGPLPGRRPVKAEKPPTTTRKRAAVTRGAHLKRRAVASTNETGSRGSVPTPTSGSPQPPGEPGER